MSKIPSSFNRNLFLASLGLIGACDVEALDDEVELDERRTALDPPEATVSLESVEVEIGARTVLRPPYGREVSTERVALFADDGTEALPGDFTSASCEICEDGPGGWSCFGCGVREAQGEGPAGGSAVTDLAQPLVAAGACPASKGDYFFLEAALGPQSFAIDVNGQIWAWGANSWGQLGIGTTTTLEVKPKKVSSAQKFYSVSGGNEHTIALANDGSVWAWGTNVYWQLGITDGTGYSSVPKKVPGVGGVVQIAAGGDFSLALTDQGKVWAWGNNSYGQVALGYLSSKKGPTVISALGSTSKIDAGFRFASALVGTTLRVWGANDRGQLGNNGLINLLQSVPQAVGLPPVYDFALGPNFMMTYNSSQEMYAWGDNTYGQLADGTTTNRNVPVKVAKPTFLNLHSMYASSSSVFVVGVSGVGPPHPGLDLVYAVGQNSFKELFTAVPGPVKTWKMLEHPGGYYNLWYLLAAGNQYTLVRLGTAVKAIGENGFGQLGDGTAVDRVALTNVCLP